MGRPDLTGVALPQAWPLLIGLVGFPALWITGLAPMAWVVLAAPMAAHLATSRIVRVPPGFSLLLLFLGWVLVTGSQVDTTGRAIAFTYRWAQFLAAGIVLLYVYNLDRRVRTGTVLGWLAVFWIIVVVGGYLGLLLPAATLPNPLLSVLPTGVSGDEFTRTLLEPTFGAVQNFLGYPIPRPAAPFPYTNTWGANFALLLPVVAAVLLDPTTSVALRRALKVAIAAAAVPAVLSLNRGMWLSIGVWLAFMLSQRSTPRVRRAAGIFALVLALALVFGSFTPLGDVVRDRLDTPHSTHARSEVAAGTSEAIAESPLLGYGAPRPYEGPGIRPPLGTQGQLWYIVFAHGIPSLVLFLAFLAILYLRSRPAECPQTGVWMRSMLIVLGVLLPIYDVEGVPMTLVFVVAGLAMREARSSRVPVPTGVGDGSP